jgi:hypothetical protein
MRQINKDKIGKKKFLDNSMLINNHSDLILKISPISTNPNFHITLEKSELRNHNLVLSKLLHEYQSQTAKMKFLKHRKPGTALNQTYSYNNKNFKQPSSMITLNPGTSMM